MDANRSVLIIRISRSGQEIDTTAFLNDAEAGDAVCYGKALLPDNELNRFCEDAGKVMSMMGSPDHPPARLLADMQHIGRSLFEILFNPETRSLLKDQGLNYLALSVDEQLIRVPWELLHDGEEFLCLRYAVGIIPGARQERFEITEKNPSKTLHALVMAPSSSCSSLAYHEGVAVINKLYLRRDAINSVLKVMDIELKFADENIGKFEIIHFLGHANYNAYDQSGSGWSFKGGIFSTGNIRALGKDRAAPAFVFSDTMQYGKQEEWPLNNFFKPEGFAIANAFLLAGTGNYAETFWRVPDEARLLFVREFYAFAVEGFPLGEALRLSRLKMIEAYGRPSLSWANCRFYGNPAISLFEKERLLSAPVKKSDELKKEAQSLLPNIGSIKRVAVRTCLFLLFIFAVKSILNFFSALEINRPDFETGLKYIFSQKNAGATARKEALDELQSLEKVDIGQSPAGSTEDEIVASAPAKETAAESQPKDEKAKEDEVKKAGGPDILNDLVSLAEKEYFDLLIKDMLKNMSRPGKAGRVEIYLHRGDYRSAVIYAKKALYVAGKANDMRALSGATALLARVYIGENHLDEARKIALESGKVFRKNGYERGIADSAFIAGLIYALPKDFSEKKSVRYLDTAAQTYLSLGDGSSAARACLVSGYTHLIAKSYTRAVKSLARGLDIVAKFPDDNVKAMTCKALGDAYFTREKYTFARAFYKKAAFLNKRPGIRVSGKTYSDILHRMALYELKQGNIDMALDYRRKIDAFKARSGRSVSMNSHNNIYEIVNSLSGKKRLSAPELDSIYFDMASACFELGYVAEANSFIDRGMQYRERKK